MYIFSCLILYFRRSSQQWLGLTRMTWRQDWMTSGEEMMTESPHSFPYLTSHWIFNWNNLSSIICWRVSTNCTCISSSFQWNSVGVSAILFVWVIFTIHSIIIKNNCLICMCIIVYVDCNYLLFCDTNTLSEKYRNHVVWTVKYIRTCVLLLLPYTWNPTGRLDKSCHVQATSR